MLFNVVVQRGKLTESIHTAKCLVKNSNSKTILSSGHSKDLIYPRSAIKIFQALPFINSGAPEKYFLNEKNLAISCCRRHEKLADFPPRDDESAVGDR